MGFIERPLLSEYRNRNGYVSCHVRQPEHSTLYTQYTQYTHHTHIDFLFYMFFRSLVNRILPVRFNIKKKNFFFGSFHIKSSTKNTKSMLTF